MDTGEFPMPSSRRPTLLTGSTNRFHISTTRPLASRVIIPGESLASIVDGMAALQRSPSLEVSSSK